MWREGWSCVHGDVLTVDYKLMGGYVKGRLKKYTLKACVGLNEWIDRAQKV